MMRALDDLLSQSQYRAPTATKVGTGFEMISMDLQAPENGVPGTKLATFLWG